MVKRGVDGARLGSIWWKQQVHRGHDQVVVQVMCMLSLKTRSELIGYCCTGMAGKRNRGESDGPDIA